MMNVYADNAATTIVSKKSAEAILHYSKVCYGNPSSIHNMGETAKLAVESARQRIANILGCKPIEIIFTSGGSESNNQAILTAAILGYQNNKRHVITSAIEHPSVIDSVLRLKRLGFEVTFVPVDENGIVSPSRIASYMREDTCLVSVMCINNEIGTIQPINDIGRICEEHKVIFHTDAVQAVGNTPFDINKTHATLLSASAHKFHGPKGVGILYCNNHFKPYKLIEGGGQENGNRAGTENVPGIVGMMIALEESVQDIEEKQYKVSLLSKRLMEQLFSINDIFLNGDIENRIKSNINVGFRGVKGQNLVTYLSERGIYASTGSACNSGSNTPSHVLQAIGRNISESSSSIRISLSAMNTQEEIDYIAKMVKEGVNVLRNFG